MGHPIHIGAIGTVFLAGLLFAGCATEGAEPGTRAGAECARNDLVAQCPQGTSPELEATTDSACDSMTSISLEQGVDELGGAGSVTHACVGQGTCRVACKLTDPCRYGVARISPSEGIICADAPQGCGNDVCDPGETPETCPRDCAVACGAGDSRCDGDRIQVCSLRGSWEPPQECPSRQACRESAGEATCQDLDLCGDGQIDTRLGPADPNYEECDDGNESNEDGCLNSCRIARCGDGAVHVGVEECDDANDSNEDSCTNTCVAARCGDGFLQPGEACDDGNTETEVCDYSVAQCQVCDAQCALVDGATSLCGDGETDLANGEACDDGNDENTDACTNTCEAPRCGDGFTQGEEACDDGNDSASDGCTPACLLASCGDGVRREDIVDPNDADFEGCDDGNGENGDACTNECTPAACGDGVQRADLNPGEAGYEGCDDGNDSDADGCVEFDGQCLPAACGDGHVRSDDPELAEDCDDGDGIDTNGCNRECRLSEIENPEDPLSAVAHLVTPLAHGGEALYRDGVLSNRDTDRFSYPVDCGLAGEFAVCPDNDLPVTRFRFTYYRETPLYGFYIHQEPINREVLFQHECLPDEDGIPVCFNNVITEVTAPCYRLVLEDECLAWRPPDCNEGCVLYIEQNAKRQGIHVQTIESVFGMICPEDDEAGIVHSALVDDHCRAVQNPTFRYTFERIE